MTRGYVAGRRKFAEKCIYRSYMKGRNEVFQFRKQNGDQSGDGLLELCPFLNFIKTVTSE